MKTADLYIRVSTDEQADKGYSQRSQEELLRKYCDINKIAIRKAIFEDHSAKTFIRPEWAKYLSDLRKHKGQADLVLFLKWDRFSRNAGDAYQMINTLRKLGVEPQAIEQPLDLSVPENKMMLAFYLAAHEVENDRRALNVIHGMRRARKEGRYMGLAPIGYANKTDESGRKYIEPSEPQASIIRWAFEKLAEGEYNTEQVFKMAKEKGFAATKNLFWFAVRNPVYCGKIFIPKYKDEEGRMVKGLHEPIITEALFYDVQDVLDGRKRHYRLKVVSDASLPLRGFLTCPEPDCDKVLTGSASKGHSKYYSYYHCSRACTNGKPCRLRADYVNDEFLKEIKKYIPRPEMADIYKITLKEAWYEQTAHQPDERKKMQVQLKDLESKLSYVMELLASKQLDPADFRQMSADYKAKIQKLETKLSIISDECVNLSDLLDKGINNLLRLDYIYETGDIEKKRKVISSIYPEKLSFSENGVRTARLNEAVRLIYTLSKAFSENKTGQNGNYSTLSSQVGTTGFEPATSCTPYKRATGLRYVPNFNSPSFLRRAANVKGFL